MGEQSQKKLILTIPFPSNQQATLVSKVLNVDKEFKGSGIQKNITALENDLNVTLEGSDYKKLRVTINGLLKNVMLVVKTIEAFSTELNKQDA